MKRKHTHVYIAVNDRWRQQHITWYFIKYKLSPQGTGTVTSLPFNPGNKIDAESIWSLILIYPGQRNLSSCGFTCLCLSSLPPSLDVEFSCSTCMSPFLLKISFVALHFVRTHQQRFLNVDVDIPSTNLQHIVFLKYAQSVRILRSCSKSKLQVLFRYHSLPSQLIYFVFTMK